MVATFKLPLPELPPPEDTICVQVTIPDARQWRANFWGVMYGLTRWYNYKEDGTHSAKDAALAWEPYFQMARDSETIGACMLLSDIRLRITDGCILQISYDAGESWEDVGDLTDCNPDLDDFVRKHPTLELPNYIVSTGSINPLQVGASGVYGVQFDVTGNAIPLKLTKSGFSGPLLDLNRSGDLQQPIILSNGYSVSGPHGIITAGRLTSLPTADQYYLDAIVAIDPIDEESTHYIGAKHADNTYFWDDLRGEDGTDGTDGTDGEDGTDGTDGEDGAGITDVELVSDFPDTILGAALTEDPDLQHQLLTLSLPAPADITEVDVVTLDPGSDADIEYDTLTHGYRKITFGIPRGDPGIVDYDTALPTGEDVSVYTYIVDAGSRVYMPMVVPAGYRITEIDASGRWGYDLASFSYVFDKDGRIDDTLGSVGKLILGIREAGDEDPVSWDYSDYDVGMPIDLAVDSDISLSQFIDDVTSGLPSFRQFGYLIAKLSLTPIPTTIECVPVGNSNVSVTHLFGNTYRVQVIGAANDGDGDFNYGLLFPDSCCVYVEFSDWDYVATNPAYYSAGAGFCSSLPIGWSDAGGGYGFHTGTDPFGELNAVAQQLFFFGVRGDNAWGVTITLS